MTTPTKQSKQSTDNLCRVYRGGSWNIASAAFVRAASRYAVTPLRRYYYFGFRTAQRGCRQPILKGVATL